MTKEELKTKTKTFKVGMFSTALQFEDALNEMASDGFELNSWSESGEESWAVVAVFVKEAV